MMLSVKRDSNLYNINVFGMAHYESLTVAATQACFEDYILRMES